MACSESQVLFSEAEFAELAGEMFLSPREGQIIGQLLSGHSDKQIALNLKIAVPTIRTHLKRTFLKLGVSDRHQLIMHVFLQFRKACYRKGCPRRMLSSERMTA